jgi:hypothetical protein
MPIVSSDSNFKQNTLELALTFQYFILNKCNTESVLKFCSKSFQCSNQRTPPAASGI